MAGLGGQHRDVAEVGQRTLQPCPRTLRKLDDRRDRFGADPEFDAVGCGVLPRFGGDLVDQRPQRRLVGGPGIEPGVHRRRNRVGPVGRNDDLAERRDRIVGGGQRPRRVHRGCEREHRVVPVGQPGGACVVRLAAERELPAPVRPDGRSDGDRAVDEIQCAALLDVQFDEDADAVGQPRVGAEVLGPAARLRHRLAQGHTVDVAQPAGLLGAQRTGGQLGADARDAEPRPLLVGEGDHRDGNPRHHAALADDVDGREGGHHTQRPVERAAVGHRIQVRARHERVGRIAGPARRHPPRPQIAVAVLLDIHAALGGAAGEPLPQGQIGVRPCVAAVAPGRGVPADVQDRRPEGVERRHAFSRIGNSHAALGGDLGGVFVAGVDVADHAHAGVVGQHPREFLRGQFGAVGDGHLAGVDGAADPDPAAVVNRHPGSRPTRC